MRGLRSYVLWAGLSVLGFCFVGMLVANLVATRGFLQQQLDSHAQDAATSLALALSIDWQPDEVQALEAVVLPVFDRGYYRGIVVRDAKGRALVEKRQTRAETAAGLLDRLFPLEAPLRKARVTHGWHDVGAVEVQSDTRFAALELRHTLWLTAVWLLLSFAAGALALNYILRRVLAPVDAVAQGALRISAGSFEAVDHSTRIRELSTLVHAFNRMTGAVRQMLESETRRVETYRAQAFNDPLTGTLNRKGMLGAFGPALEAGGKNWLLLAVELEGLQHLNSLAGFAQTDLILIEISRRLARELRPSAIARLRPAQFLLLMQVADPLAARELVGAARSHLQASLRTLAPASLRSIAGGVLEPIGERGEDWLEQADAVLERARKQGDLAVVVETGAKVADGAAQPSERRALLRRQVLDSLSDGGVVLVGQPTRVLDGHSAGHANHCEVFGRIRDELGHLLPARVFLPAVEGREVGVRLDRAILEALHARVGQAPNETRYAVNLGHTSLADAWFMTWLTGWLGANRQWGAKLILETSESAALGLGTRLPEVVGRLRAAGTQFGLDSVGLAAQGIGLLADVRPAYVKLAPDLAPHGDGEHAQRFLFQSLVRIARTLEIPVIATGLETKHQIGEAKDAGCTAAMGYAISAENPL
ncbi:MAG: EAL domain-containing protein [Rhodocyclaceae bacterium]|nr:EAL domain-containing protein [Rhodocyclaceae bacterium]MBX3666975.1 EAL domain-containing protein [Rhodocyclaceae bacterium]